MYPPKEVIYRHAFSQIAEYLAKRIADKRKDGYVAVLVEDYWETIFYAKCDKRGYPEYHNIKILEVPSLTVSSLGESIANEIMCREVEIYIEEPLVSNRYNLEDYPTIFLWKGRIMSKDLIPVEKLNVKELMRVAQTAIKNREGLIIDEALKNKIYK